MGLGVSRRCEADYAKEINMDSFNNCQKEGRKLFLKNYEKPSEAPPTLRSLAERELSSSSLFSENALPDFLLRRFPLSCVAAAH